MKLTLAIIALLGSSGIRLRDGGPTCDEAFNFLDKNHNGEITEHEAKTQLEKAVKHGELSKEESKKIFYALGRSAGKDNMVNKHEFAKVWKKEGGRGECHLDNGPTCDEAFNFLDKNHNGEITEHEAKTQLKKAVEPGELSKKEAHHIYNALGRSTGKDDMVNKHEFAKVWKKQGGRGRCHLNNGPTCEEAFDFLDKNHNGKITEHEAKTQLHKAVKAGELSKKEAHHIYNALGRSAGSDNMVDKHEFAKVCKKLHLENEPSSDNNNDNGSSGYPGTRGCERTCEGYHITKAACGKMSFCQWDDGKCWSGVGGNPCPKTTPAPKKDDDPRL